MAEPRPERHLERYADNINRCFRCGLCRSVCPSFAAAEVEAASPRGRVQYARSLLAGELGHGDVEDRMLDCLGCMRCADICPSGVRTDRIVTAVRAELVDRGRLHPVKRLAFRGVLTHPAIMRIATTIGALGDRAVYRPSDALRELVPRIAGMEDKAFPAFAPERALDRLPETVPSGYGSTRLRAAYFVGCATNLLYPEVAEATVRVLSRMGVELVIPRGVSCCGIPAYSSGDFDSARTLARRNRAVLDALDVDCIVTDCASCSSALKHGVEEALGMPAASKPVYDLTELLADLAADTELPGPVEETVTYHDPCHLARGQGITEEPRDVLKRIPGLEFIEMTDADACCGGAGTFTFTHHSLARKVGASKVRSIRETGAAIVATPCPACRMQLDDLLAHGGLAVQVRHPVELLDRAYRRLDMTENGFEFVETHTTGILEES